MRCSRRHLQRLLARRCPAAFAPPRFPLPSSFLLLLRGTVGYPSIRIVGCSLLPSLPSTPKNQICSSLPPPNQDPLLPSESIRTRRRDAASSRRWRRRLVRDGEAAAAALPQEPLQMRQSATDVVLSVLSSLGQVLQHYCEKHFHAAAPQTPTPERPTATRLRILDYVHMVFENFSVNIVVDGNTTNLSL